MVLSEYGLLPRETVTFSWGPAVSRNGDHLVIDARGHQHHTRDGGVMRLLTTMVLEREENQDRRDYYSHASATEKVLRVIFDLTTDAGHKPEYLSDYAQWFRLAERYYAVKCKFESEPPAPYWPRDGSRGDPSSPAW